MVVVVETWPKTMTMMMIYTRRGCSIILCGHRAKASDLLVFIRWFPGMK